MYLLYEYSVFFATTVVTKFASFNAERYNGSRCKLQIIIMINLKIIELYLPNRVFVPARLCAIVEVLGYSYLFSTLLVRRTSYHDERDVFLAVISLCTRTPFMFVLLLMSVLPLSHLARFVQQCKSSFTSRFTFGLNLAET